MENITIRIPKLPEDDWKFLTILEEDDPGRKAHLGYIDFEFTNYGNPLDPVLHALPDKVSTIIGNTEFDADRENVRKFLQQDVLKSRYHMRRFCEKNGFQLPYWAKGTYGFVVETEKYMYYLMCVMYSPIPYANLNVFDKKILKEVEEAAFQYGAPYDDYPEVVNG